MRPTSQVRKSFRSRDDQPMSETFDVIVVGFGLAGAIAAIEAHDAGAKVLLVEKAPVPGGISICAGGGVRFADSFDKALSYLKATCAGTTPEPVLARLAHGMVELPNYIRKLAEPLDAKYTVRVTKGNYALPGYETWGNIEIVDIPGFDPIAEYPHVRAEGQSSGRRMFKAAHEAVKERNITVRLNCPVERLWMESGEIRGVVCGELIRSRLGVVLACGGFEAAADLQRQFWPTPPIRAVATLGNTGDGIRMGQEVGAGLWHMWHLHGVYGFHFPDPTYKLGIRIRRLRNWVPGLKSSQDTLMSWILVDQSGHRYMNEYDPYMQDTNHRPMALFDPVTQSYPRIPSVLVLDAKGREVYTLCEPIFNDAEMAPRFGTMSLWEFDDSVLVTRPTLDGIADEFGLDHAVFSATVADWNAACAQRIDRTFGRPPGSMMPIAEPPFSAAPVWPVVSNTQGGLPHDEDQRVLTPFGEPISRLYVAGELGSVFGHLYLAGGNYSECLIAGQIAGTNVAHLMPWQSNAA